MTDRINSCFFFADLPRVKLGLGSTLDPDSIKEGDDVYFECSINAKLSIQNRLEVQCNLAFFGTF